MEVAVSGTTRNFGVIKMNITTIRKKLTDRVPLVALVATLCWLTAAHAATVYIWRDADGNRQYSDYCPTGEKCRVKNFSSSGETSGPTKKGKGWKDTTTTDTSTTDTGTSSDSGTTGGDTTGDTGSSGGTTTTTDNTTEPTPDETNDTTTAGDTTTDTPTDNTASLEWDPVNSPDLAGYRVYHAVAGGTYPAFGSGINAGSSTSITISRLDSGTRYYFRVTAVDNMGNESGFSNEAYKDIP